MSTPNEIPPGAAEAAKHYLQFKLGDRRGCKVLDVAGKYAEELIAECAEAFQAYAAEQTAELRKELEAAQIERDEERMAGFNQVAEIAQLRKERDAVRSTLHDANRRHNETWAENLQLKQRVAELEKDAAGWKDHSAVSDKELCQIQDALGCPCEGERDAMERVRDLIAAEGELGDLRAEIAELRKERDALRRRVAELEQRLTQAGDFVEIAEAEQRGFVRGQSDNARLRADNAALAAAPCSTSDVIRIRCIRHINVPQLNAKESTGAECGGCIAEKLDSLRDEIRRYASSIVFGSPLHNEEVARALRAILEANDTALADSANDEGQTL